MFTKDLGQKHLLYIVHNIRQNRGQKKIKQGLFLDVSSAFDKVWHNCSLVKRSQIGVVGSVYNILRSYLSDRRQVVVVDGQKSDMLDVKAGWAANL